MRRFENDIFQCLSDDADRCMRGVLYISESLVCVSFLQVHDFELVWFIADRCTHFTHGVFATWLVWIDFIWTQLNAEDLCMCGKTYC